MPHPVPLGLPVVTFLLVRVYADRSEELLRTLSADPGAVLVWTGGPITLAVLFHGNPSAPRRLIERIIAGRLAATPTAVTVRADGPSVPVVLRFRGALVPPRRSGRNPRLSSWPRRRRTCQRRGHDTNAAHLSSALGSLGAPPTPVRRRRERARRTLGRPVRTSVLPAKDSPAGLDRASHDPGPLPASAVRRSRGGPGRADHGDPPGRGTARGPLQYPHARVTCVPVPARGRSGPVDAWRARRLGTGSTGEPDLTTPRPSHAPGGTWRGSRSSRSPRPRSRLRSTTGTTASYPRTRRASRRSAHRSTNERAEGPAPGPSSTRRSAGVGAVESCGPPSDSGRHARRFVSEG